MTGLDRAELIALLYRLGSGDDATVLEAARALHRRAAESGLSWDELLRLDRDDGAAGESPADDGQDARPLTPDAAETARLIERLLRKDLSETLRHDLNEMNRNIAEGDLDATDSRYVRALAKRLGAA